MLPMKRLLLLLLALISSAYSLQLANPESRTSIDLNGDWKIIVDPYDVGLADYRGRIRPDGYFRNAKPRDGYDLVEYNFDKSETLRVPGDWNSQHDKFFFYEGSIWYKRDFNYTPKPDARAFLHVGAANYAAKAWINGEFACEHEGGFTPFDCEVTKLVRPGTNFVIIHVNNTRKREAVPTNVTDWWNYGGITREVSLVEVPSRFIQDYSVQLKRGSAGEISGWVQLSDKSAQAVTIRIPELKIEKSVKPDANGRAEFFVAAQNFQRWSPESPKLYAVEIASGADTIKDEIGFRTIEVRGDQILLNGKPIFLRGVCIHEEAPYRSGRANSTDDAHTLLGWAKELNANFVRLAHYPHNQNMTREADRLGLLVWSEIPVYWMIDYTNQKTLANAKQQLTEMITRDRNRASIALWSVANETPVNDDRMAFLRQLISTARQLDPTRLITAAMDTTRREQGSVTINDPLAADLDVLGVNEYIGWYGGKPEDAPKTNWINPYNKPLIMSEFGADAKYGLQGPIDQKFTEEYQENLYRQQVAMLKQIPFLRGASPWILMDFRSPRRPLPGVQDFYNRKGLVSDKGEKKKAFYVMQQWYAEKAKEQN
jgi:beta-glucuronidase